MAYRDDPDLQFLSCISSENLNPLVEILTKDKDGDGRWTEELTKNELYKKFYPDHHRYWEVIAGEIQCFGANSLATILRRGKCVLYKEILCDVCDKMKVNYNNKAQTNIIEQNLLMKVIETSIDKMSQEDIQNVVKELDLKVTDFSSQAVLFAIQSVIKNNVIFFSNLSSIVASSVTKTILGTGSVIVVNSGLARLLTIFAGPIGIGLTELWTFADIAGPAYRVTIPAVIIIAYLRLSMQIDK